MILTEVSAPPVEAVPIRAFGDHLRLAAGFADDGALDGVLELYLRAAMAAIEARIGSALLVRAYTWTLTRWREDASQTLPIGPIRAIESIRLVSAEGETVEADPETWSVLRDARRPRLVGGWSGASGATCRASRGAGMPRSASSPASARAGTQCRPTCGRRPSCSPPITSSAAPRRIRPRRRCPSGFWC